MSKPQANITLKKAREAKGFSLEIVHEATKIPLDVLKAIEEGYSVKMLTPFYYRGFVKIYAQFLGLNPADVLLGDAAAQKPDVPINNKIIKKPTVKSNVMPGASSPLADVFSGIKRRLAQPFVRQMIVRIIIAIIVIWLGITVVKAIGRWVASWPKKTTVATKAPVIKTDLVAEKIKAAKSEAPLPKIVKAQSVDQKVQLVIRAMRDTYVQVKSDDKVVFQMTMKKGTMESWTGNKEIELSGKNIHLLDLEINGKHIGTLGNAERQAKKVLINKDGLSVKK